MEHKAATPVIESANARALIKNGKKTLIKLMSADVLACFISRSRRNEDPLISLLLIFALYVKHGAFQSPLPMESILKELSLKKATVEKLALKK
jgi:hypothetical protein